MNWKQHRLDKSTGTNYRFKIIRVKKEMALAFLIEFEDVELWVPKSICILGIEPGGHYYAIDLPKWFCDKNKLI